MAEGTQLVLKQIGNYKFLNKTLGKGNFARVELAEHKLTGAKVAIKVINLKTVKEEYVRRNILREALIMKKIHHENIIKLYETLKYDCVYCLVTELVKGGDLRTYVHQQKNNKLGEGRARILFRQLLSAVKHLHDSGIVHRDLKMDNILLDETKTVVKIVDFGLSNLFSKGELLRTHCGSPEYAAPELFEQGCLYGPSVDVWSMGVVLYAMVVGHLPFSTMYRGYVGKNELYRHAKRGLTLAHERYLGRLSKGCRNLLTKLLQADPTKRITFEYMTHHPWITDDGKNPLIKQPSVFVPKSVRDKVIEKVASLCGISTQETEHRVQGSRHDAVSAVYNLLLEEAVKECKSTVRVNQTKPKVASTNRRSSAGSRSESKQISSVKFKSDCANEMQDDMVIKDASENRFDEQGVKMEGKVSRNEKLRSTKDASPEENQANQSSGVKIVEFKDAIKLDGRAKTPIIRKPPTPGKYWAAYPPQSETSRHSPQYLKARSTFKPVLPEDQMSDQQGKPERQTSSEMKRNLFCGDFSKGIEAGCTITRFPEEDKSNQRNKVEKRSMPSSDDPKQLTYRAVSPHRASIHGSDARRPSEKPTESQNCDSAGSREVTTQASPSGSDGRRLSNASSKNEVSHAVTQWASPSSGDGIRSSNASSKSDSSRAVIQRTSPSSGDSRRLSNGSSKNGAGRAVIQRASLSSSDGRRLSNASNRNDPNRVVMQRASPSSSDGRRLSNASSRNDPNRAVIQRASPSPRDTRRLSTASSKSDSGHEVIHRVSPYSGDGRLLSSAASRGDSGREIRRQASQRSSDGRRFSDTPNGSMKRLAANQARRKSTGGKIPEEPSSNYQRLKQQQQQQRQQKPQRKQGPEKAVQRQSNRDSNFSFSRMRERESCKRFSDAFLELRRRVAPFNEKIRRNSTGNEIRQEGINENRDKVKNRNEFSAPEYGYEMSKPTGSVTQRDSRYDSFGLGLKDSLKIYEKQNKSDRAEQEARGNKAENNVGDMENIAKPTQGQKQHEGPVTPQTNAEQQRRVSLGILKAPSRCSSTDLTGANGKEKRKLKVTFQDEVVQQARKLPSKSAKVLLRKKYEVGTPS